MTDSEDKLFMKFISIAMPTTIGICILGIIIPIGISLYNVIINYEPIEIFIITIIMVLIMIIAYGIGYVFLKFVEDS